MSGLIKARFRNTDGSIISDRAHIDDYNSSPSLERVRFGKLCMYYRDLLKKYAVPYGYIDRVYTKTVVCPENEFANNEEYYRLVLIHQGKEFAELVLQKKKTVESIYAELERNNSNIVFGNEE